MGSTGLVSGLIVGGIVNGIVGGFFLVVILACMVWFFWRPGRADTRDVAGLAKNEQHRRLYEDGYKERKDF